MKKIISCIALIAAVVASAAEVPLYPAVKKNTPVQMAAFENSDGTYRLAFKLASGTAEDFALGGVYVFADEERSTGRKNIGNEYFLDVTKKTVSTYSADGKGKLHRKAVSADRVGDWYILSFSDKLASETVLKEFEIVFNVGKKSDRIVLRGVAPEKVGFPTVSKELKRK